MTPKSAPRFSRHRQRTDSAEQRTYGRRCRNPPHWRGHAGDPRANNSVTRTRKPWGKGFGRVEIGVLSRAVRQQEGMLSHDMPACTDAYFARSFTPGPTFGPPGGLGSAAPHFEQTSAPSPLSVPQTGQVPRTRRGMGFPSHFPHETQTAHMASSPFLIAA